MQVAATTRGGSEPSVPAEERRPPREHVALASARWAEYKPDAASQRKKFFRVIFGRDAQDGEEEALIGVTGACLMNESGRFVAIEGSGMEHVCSVLCIRLRPQLQSGVLVLSRFPCPTCVRRLAECGARKVLVPSVQSYTGKDCLMEPDTQGRALTMARTKLAQANLFAALLPSNLYGTEQLALDMLQQLTQEPVADAVTELFKNTQLRYVFSATPPASPRNTPPPSPRPSSAETTEEEDVTKYRQSETKRRDEVVTQREKAFEEARKRLEDAKKQREDLDRFSDQEWAQRRDERCKRERESRRTSAGTEEEKRKKAASQARANEFLLALADARDYSLTVMHILSTSHISLNLIDVPIKSLPMRLLSTLKAALQANVGVGDSDSLVQLWCMGLSFICSSRAHDALEVKQQYTYVGCCLVERTESSECDVIRVIGLAYNGTPTGVRDVHFKLARNQLKSIHAEENAMLHCQSESLMLRREQVWAYVTERPCNMCARLLLSNMSPRKVLFFSPTRGTERIVTASTPADSVRSRATSLESNDTGPENDTYSISKQVDTFTQIKQEALVRIYDALADAIAKYYRVTP